MWEASGHLSAFADPLVECLKCHRRYRADHLQEEFAERKGLPDPDAVALTEIPCPNCGTRGEYTEPRQFNGLLKTYLGVIEDESGLHYLRPETAQGIFVNFANVVQTTRKKPPFGIGQVGKSFRNEITPGNFIFRTREFEQMEMEFFVVPGTDEEWHQYWIDERTSWYVDLGISRDNLRHFEHAQEKLSHYSKRTVDIEYRFEFAGSQWGELEGIANRTDFDLGTHSRHSGTDLSFFDQANNERFIPYVIEPAAGLTRSLMAFLIEAYTEDEAPNTKGGVDKRTVLKLDPRLAPVKVAVLPLSRNEALSPKAQGSRGRAAEVLERRLRRRPGDRPPLPSPGRDRYAVLHHRRLRHPRRRRGDDPRARHHGAGSGQPGQGHRLPGDPAGGLLILVASSQLGGSRPRWVSGWGSAATIRLPRKLGRLPPDPPRQRSPPRGTQRSVDIVALGAQHQQHEVAGTGSSVTLSVPEAPGVSRSPGAEGLDGGAPVSDGIVLRGGLELGKLVVDVPVILAPMAGVTNAAYRQLCREQAEAGAVPDGGQAGSVRLRDDHQPRDRRG